MNTNTQTEEYGRLAGNGDAQWAENEVQAEGERTRQQAAHVKQEAG